MRLADTFLRGGHLSERSLVDALMTGNRPVHLDRCDLCSCRAVELGRWLDDVKGSALDQVDHVFPPERLAFQQAQILRRLEQMDEPSRVIAFPSMYPLETRAMARRRVAPAWVGVAAAAGIVLGAIGGQIAARAGGTPATPTQPAEAARTTTPLAAPGAGVPTNASLREINSVMSQDLENMSVSALDGLNEITPRVLLASNTHGGG